MPRKTKQTQTKTAAELFERGQQIIRETQATPPAAMPVPAPPPLAVAPATALAPAVDLLRVQDIYNLEKTRPMDAEALRGQLVDLIDRSLQELSTSMVQQVAQFVDISLNEHGCITPAEEFITGLVSTHYFANGLIPDEVRDLLKGPEGFETNFSDFVDNTKRAKEMYPNTFTS